MEKLVIQGKVEERRSRGRSPVQFIDQIKSLANIPMEEVMKTTVGRGVEAAVLTA